MRSTAKLTILGAAIAASLAGFAIERPDRATALVILPALAQQSPSAGTTVTEAAVTLHSDSVELPLGEAMFPGSADEEAINNNCLSCHSAGMVLSQPGLPRSTWLQLVEKMRSKYNAPVAEEDVPVIVTWLANHKGAR